MKKIIISLSILIILIFLSYKIMTDFQETNKVNLSFYISPNSHLNDLRVNVFIMKSDAPSEWYSYYKTITVIDKGMILSDFRSRYVLAYQIEGMSKLKQLYYNSQLLDNAFARKEDFKINYIFGSDFIRATENTTIDFSQNPETEKYSKLEKNIDLKYYNPKTTKYQITEITEESLLFLKTKSFDELKVVSKIKSKDIFKLNQLTYNEKIELVKIHNTKYFNKPME
ncbi:hypothetical protein QR665_20725 [Acinetobacter gerneri]|uniref:hypothetical protein n=1 Tax=Acinetobacter gerneri TaxID=202952 RepID=UPI002936963A|nr:hypothetical protein [Acinetobacter gerneri]MDV2441847.1 hypothetical protein [Acinetobacter gerneri]